jgi:hypothetical protein
MNKPLLDLNSNYVKHYFQKVSEIAQDIIKQDYSSIQEYKMPASYNSVEKGSWYFRIVKSKDTGICLTNFESDIFKEIVNDDNVMCVGVNRFPPGTIVKEHIDPPYYGKNLWRILVPIKASNAYLKGNNGIQKAKVGNCYIFDITYEQHCGWNSADEDFIIMTIDVLYEKNQDYVGDFYHDGIVVNDTYIFNEVKSVNLEMYEKI